MGGCALSLQRVLCGDRQSVGGEVASELSQERKAPGKHSPGRGDGRCKCPEVGVQRKGKRLNHGE